ncbi:hypothetical protein HPB49_013916 [Dermacentor silvarum]|uniref:Uncharacterized protein n=1 Tax=Dermacentor silvarum TaxID=543639 RepID=A0ACB8C3Z5_DERSI|nr:hypothetical protein HPB49_013916 [Dermacentor silvarum]
MQAALQKLRTVRILGHAYVRWFIVHGGHTGTVVIFDVVINISDEELQRLLSSTVKVMYFQRFGRSTGIKLPFEGDTLPDHVKVGHVRHPVRTYMPRTLQCHKCLKLSHVSAVCTGQTTCLRCGGIHDISSCTVKEIKCGGPHEANSKDCPKQKKEIEILNQMSKITISHKEAAAAAAMVSAAAGVSALTEAARVKELSLPFTAATAKRCRVRCRVHVRYVRVTLELSALSVDPRLASSFVEFMIWYGVRRDLASDLGRD